MWVRPEQILSDEAVRDKPRARFGGTLFAKYNRGVRGQFFVAVRETGCAFLALRSRRTRRED